jgi:hypothetical protein
MLQLLVTANVVPSSLILVTLMMEVICSSETLLLTRAIRHNISEDSIFQNEKLVSKLCFDHVLKSSNLPVEVSLLSMVVPPLLLARWW